MSQLILPFNKDELYLEENFIISTCNQSAYSTLINWTSGFGVNPYPRILLLCGPESSGKTHLATIWQRLSGAQFINLGVDFSKQLAMNHPAFIIEDIDKKLKKATNLLHYFNRINEEKKYLLLTSSSLNLKFKLPDLLSRLNSIKTLEIDSPDDGLIKLLIFRIFAELSLKFNEEVSNFLLTRLPRNFNIIASSIQNINNYALLHQRKITIPLIKEILDI